MTLKKTKGSSLIEMLVYVAVLIIILSAISYFFLGTTRSGTKIKANQKILNNARRAMESITYEIRQADKIYFPTSSFGSHPGQISLKTTLDSPQGEKSTYVDFYLCDDRICQKKEGIPPSILTPADIAVTKLIFEQIATTSPSLQVTLGLEMKEAQKPEEQASTELNSTVSLRKK